MPKRQQQPQKDDEDYGGFGTYEEFDKAYRDMMYPEGEDEDDRRESDD